MRCTTKLIGSIFLFLLFGCLTSFGQIKTGTVLLSGTVSLERNSLPENAIPDEQSQDEKVKTFIAGPQAALFVAKNLSVGL